MSIWKNERRALHQAQLRPSPYRPQNLPADMIVHLPLLLPSYWETQRLRVPFQWETHSSYAK